MTALPAIRDLWARMLVKRSTPAPPAAASGAAPAPLSARAPVLLAAVPSAASLVWTAWSVTDMLPAPLPVGLAAGVVLDVALVSAVAIAWVAPDVARPAKAAGWAIASLAAVLVGWHAAQITLVLAGLGLIPLVSKALWHLALDAKIARHAAEAEAAETARRAAEAAAAREEERQRVAAEEAERRDAELDPGLTHDQRAEIADKLRRAAYLRELAAAEREVEDAEAEAAHQAELARIRRAGAQQREMDREDAATVKARIALTREIRASEPADFALPSAEPFTAEVRRTGTGPAEPVSGNATGNTGTVTPMPHRLTDAELETLARQVYEPGMSVSAFRQALGVGMKKAHPLHQMLRSETG